VRRSEIEEQNQLMLRRQREFRLAADVVTDAWMAFDEVQAVAVIGSVAKALWKGDPAVFGFSPRRDRGLHECSDLDLALWIETQARVPFAAPWLKRCARPLTAAPESAWSVSKSTSS
jgi:hypothetical protein